MFASIEASKLAEDLALFSRLIWLRQGTGFIRSVKMMLANRKRNQMMFKEKYKQITCFNVL